MALGTGIGAVAALVAHDAGAKVLILEKAGFFGGTTAHTGGGVAIPNNYLMRQAGVAVSREKALTYLRSAAEGQSSEELMVAFIDKANEAIEWLRDNASFVWQRSPSPTPSFAEYYPYEGAVHASHGVSILREDGTRGGAGLSLTLKEAINKRGIEVMLKTPGRRLITNASGEVIGIIAESEGKEIAIKARRAVIIGTGGFEHNKEMVRHYLRAPIHAVNTTPERTGDGHLMAMAIGADMRNMNECFGLPHFKPDPELYSGIADWQIWRGKPGAVTVNKHGERIGNESSAYDPSERSFHTYDTGRFEWRNIPSFCLFDSGYTKYYALPAAKVGEVPAWITKADSLEALATALGINVVGLRSTIETFNKNARDGIDPVWRRGEVDFDRWTAGDLKRTDIKNPCLAPLETPPYYGAALWPGTTGTAGGLRANGNAQVLDVWVKVIPRLYVTSTAMASVHGVAYPWGGAPLGQGLVFGYIAGAHAAGLTPWV